MNIKIVHNDGETFEPMTFASFLQLIQKYTSLDLEKIATDLNENGFAMVQASGTNPPIKIIKDDQTR